VIGGNRPRELLGRLILHEVAHLDPCRDDTLNPGGSQTFDITMVKLVPLGETAIG